MRGGGDRIARKAPVMHKVHKPPRKTAPKGAGKKRAQRRDAPPLTLHALPAAAAAPRWALVSDGAFLLLDPDFVAGRVVEIPAPAARALVEFVCRLDAGAA